MKLILKNKIVLVLGIAATALFSGCVVEPYGAVAVQAPPPPVVVEPVPDEYVWDGYEYVGVVGAQYYYLGPRNVWLTMDVNRQARFHEWERAHADWREHAVRNELYRRRSPDGHKIDGRSPDGQKVDGRSPDGQKVDGRSPDGQKVDGRSPDGQKVDGRSPDGQKVNGRSPDGQKVDGRSPDGQKVDGRSPDGQKLDGRSPDGQKDQPPPP